MSAVRKMSIAKKTLYPVIAVIALTILFYSIYTFKQIRDIENNVYRQEAETNSTYIEDAFHAALDVLMTNAVSISQITPLPGCTLSRPERSGIRNSVSGI